MSFSVASIAQDPEWTLTESFVGVGTGSPEAKLHVKVDDGAYNLPFIVQNVNGINFSGFRLQISPTSFIDFNNSGGKFRINVDQVPGAEFEVRPNGDATLTGALTQNSDVYAKQNIEAIFHEDVLAKVMDLPITEWSYKDAPTSRHIGPMAQDFYKSFGLGDTSTGISSIDTGGVALAAIQAVKIEKDTEIARLKLELSKQEERVLQLEIALAEVLRNQSSEIHVSSTN
jgi:hypothetical protein